jgi:hypothetical protein
LYKPIQGRCDAPKEGDEGDPAAGRKFLEHQIRWHLKCDVCNEEDRHCDLELIADESKVSLQMIQTRISDVDTEKRGC